MLAKNINLFMMDGNPDGRIKCSITSYPIIVYKIPRSLVDDCKEKEELKGSGIYFLVGTDENDKPSIYVGQGVVRKDGLGVLRRVLEPHDSIEYWTEAIILVSSSSSNILGPTELNYLEHEFCKIATNAKRYNIKNGNDPNVGDFSEEKETEMQEFIEYAKLLIGAIGYKFLLPLITIRNDNFATNKIAVNNNISKSKNFNIMQTHLFIKARGALAEGMMSDEGFVLLKGSQIAINDANSCKGETKELRKKVLEKYPNGKIEEDIVYCSPSAASKVVLGRSSNGRDDWKDVGGRSINQLEKIT